MPDNNSEQNSQSVKDSPKTESRNPLQRIADRIQGGLNNLYKSTYYSDPENRRQLNIIKTDITSSIKDMMTNNSDDIGEPNISRLYERLLLGVQKDPGTVTELERIFGDNEFVNNLTSSYLDNRWVKEVDAEIDEILRYMPKMREAILTIKDNIIAADSFNKDCLNMESTLGDASSSHEQFVRNIEDMKMKYKANEFVDELYDNIGTYGEAFVYIVPYTKAIQRLLDTKNDNHNVTVNSNFGENAIIIESSVDGITSITPEDDYKLSSENDSFNINLEVDNGGVIKSIVGAEYKARNLRESASMSLTEQYYQESIPSVSNNGSPWNGFSKVTNNDIEMNGKLPVHHNFDITLDDDLQIPKDFDDPTTDGLININKTSRQNIKNMNGCIVKMLPRECVSPIIMNDICLGYYYFEFDPQYGLFEERFTSTGMVNTITGIRSNGRAEAFDSMQRREELIRNVAAQLAAKIDKKFIDANQNLKKEIYYILKYNQDFNTASHVANNIRVTYIPPEDIKHCYFKLDKDTSRGVSDMALSLIPAKLYVAIYITNCLAVMTRGNDKRVYYVKQSVESNISKTLLKTIDEIKKSNFGIRQVENINSILNITGRFNDYIIPRGSDGQSPIEFEVMQGQNVEIKTDLLNILEESAINVTGVPIELIQNRQSPDYAIQFTMSNSKFLRFVYARQSVFQTILSDIFTRIYRMEYGTSDRISVFLPPPLFINITNTNQLIVNINDYAQNVVDIIAADETNETVKTILLKKIKRYHLASYINSEMLDRLYNEAKQEATLLDVLNGESNQQD